MPILAEEVSLFPDDLFTTVHQHLLPEQSSSRWRLLYTKPRQEKSLARDLLALEIPFFLPLVPKENLIRGRRIRSHLPLFTGYVFLFADDQDRIGSLETDRVAYVIDVVEQQRLSNELHQLHRLMATRAPFTVESQFVPGQRVRIKSGPFNGIEGTMMSRRGTTRLLVAIHYLGQGVSIEIDDFQIETI